MLFVNIPIPKTCQVQMLDRAGDLSFSMSLHLPPFFMNASSKGPGKDVQDDPSLRYLPIARYPFFCAASFKYSRIS